MNTLRQELHKLFVKTGTFALMVRHAESLANLGGTLAGWSDAKLTDYGKRQAHYLYHGLHDFYPRVNGIYSSDLIRCVATTQLATLHSWSFSTDERLRECYFGDHEGEHFDTLGDELKLNINSPEYISPNGESWEQVNRRAEDFLREKGTQQGVYMCVSHGGTICRLSYFLGFTDALPNGGVLALRLVEGKPRELEFVWKMPEVPEF